MEFSQAERENAASQFSPPSWSQQFIELFVFLLLIVPSMALSLLDTDGQSQSNAFTLVAVSMILRDFALVSLIFYFLWRNRESMPQIGLRFTRVRKDVAIGILLFVPFFFASSVLESDLRSVGFSAPAPSDEPSFLAYQGDWQIALAAFLVVVVAIAEEITFRGYLMLRFTALTQSPLLAAVCSALIFSLGHGYEGSAGMVTVAAMGFGFALVYLWRGSLVAPIVIHFLQDFVGVVILPQVTGH